MALLFPLLTATPKVITLTMQHLWHSVTDVSFSPTRIPPPPSHHTSPSDIPSPTTTPRTAQGQGSEVPSLGTFSGTLSGKWAKVGKMGENGGK